MIKTISGRISLLPLLACICAASATALNISQLTNQDAARGIKGALTSGTSAAIGKLEQYVTHKALDGLYVIIGEEERAIRQNPMAAGSAIVSKVFGALKN